MRPRPLVHDDIPACIAQRDRPSSCVVEEEWLLHAGDKICARERTRYDARRLVTAARRSAKDHAINIWMPKSESEGKLSTRRYAQHCSTFSGQRHGKPRRRPSVNFTDKEILVRREPLRLKTR